MKKFFSATMLCLSFTMLLHVTACKKNDDKKDNITTCINPAVVVVDNTFDFTKPVTLHGCTVYYFNYVNQYSIESTLTIEAGAILKFPKKPAGSAFVLHVSGNGKILANGTESNPVVFTSERDDVHGGDTNGDGATTAAAAGDWSYISLDAGQSIFNYCQFLYNGSGSGLALFEINAENVAFNNCTFANNKGSADVAGKGVLHYFGSVAGTTLNSNTFYNNVKPLTINEAMDIDNSNQFHNPTDATQKNTYNGIFVHATCCGTGTSLSWLENEVPFVFHAYYHTQPINAAHNAQTDPVIFTVGEGVIIKFVAESNDYGPGITIRSDNSQISGKDLPGVFFTSYKDDAHGGDTNADGNSTSPSASDWDGISDAAAIVNAPKFYYSWGNILYAKN